MHEADLTDVATLDLRDLFQILRRRYKLILTVFLCAIVCAAIASLMLPPVYQAETTLRIKQSKGLGESLLADLPIGNPLATKQLMSTYAEIIKSRTVIAEVIQLCGWLKQKPGYEGMLQRITISPVRDTEIIKLQVRGNSPDEAQKIANLVVEVFLRRIASLARSEQTMVREFIAGRLAAARQELAKSEKRLQDYKSRQKIIAPTEETKALVTQLAEVNRLVAENNIELVSTMARLQSASQQLSAEKPGFMAENALIQQCKSKLVELEVELVGLLQKYTENHPQVQALRAAINETKQKLGTEIERIVNAEAASLNPIHQGLLQDKLKAEAELAALKAQKDALDSIIAREESALVRLPAKEQGLARVMRDAMLAQDIFIMLAKRHEEARISEVMQPTDVQIIDRAIAPDQPIKPNKRLNVMIAALLGLFAGTGLALGLELLNQTIVDADDVQRYLELPVLGSIPEFGSAASDLDYGRKVRLKPEKVTGI